MPGANPDIQRAGASRSGSGTLRGSIIVLTLALAAGAGWWFMHRSPAPAGDASVAAAGAPGRAGRNSASAGRAQPVSVGTVAQRDIAVAVTAIGTIAANNNAIVRAKVGGELKALYFTEGKPVKAGQVLALIEPKPFEIALSQAQAVLMRDQAQLRNAQVDLERYKDLVAKDAAPKQQLDTQEALVKQLQGTVQADQAAVDNARLQLSYTRVVAPISGLAGLKQADLGNVVNPTDPNGLLSIAQTQPVAVVFAVPETQLPRIRQPLQAGQPLAVQAWDREQKTMLAEGRVASTDNSIDVTTGTIKVKALFANADNGLFPNQFVNVRLQLDTLAGVLAVPTAAVQRGAPGTFVYAVADDGTVSLHRVTVNATDGDWSAVQADLKPGTKVVIDGADRLRDGAKAEVIERSGSTPTETVKGRQRSASAAAGASAPMAAASADHPRWMDRVPPEMVDKLKAMSDDERRAWFQKQREQRGGN